MGSNAQTSRAPHQEGAILDTELADVQTQIRAYRESLATLHAESERDEARYEVLKAEHEQMQVELNGLRDALRASSRKRTELVTELDNLLLSKTRLEGLIEKSASDHKALAAVDMLQDGESDLADGRTASFAIPGQQPEASQLEIDLDMPAPEATVSQTLEIDMMARSGAANPNLTRAAPPRAAVQAKPAAAPPPAPTKAAPAPATAAQGTQLRMATPVPQNKVRGPQPRVPMCVDVDLRSENNLYMGFSENVSEGGLFVATYTPRPVGERLQVQFTLPNQNRAITCDVEVAWHVEARDVMAHDKDRVPGMGLHFVNLTADDRAMLLDFVTRREPMFFPV